jgi:hypothetical protein
MSVTCGGCGTVAAADSAYCEGCGTRLSQPPVAPSGSAAPPRVDEPSTTSSPGSSWSLGDMSRSFAKQPQTARSKAWVYYAILAILSLISVFTGHAVGLVGVLLFGGYSTYIYRGGRIIFWFW